MTQTELEISRDEEKKKANTVISSFQIRDAASFKQWDTDIWPKLQQLFATTWPELNTPEFNRYFDYTDILNRPNSSVILMRKNNEIVASSFVYDSSEYRRDQSLIWIPDNERTAYNSTVIVDPRYRGQGLMIPLLEQTLKTAADLGYDYMVGHYNRATGVMSDGRRVATGFSHRVKEHTWQNGNIIYTRPVEFRHADNSKELSETIVFRLPVRLSVAVPSVRRKPLIAAA